MTGRDPATSKGSSDMNELPNIVLVHGAWADGSSWSEVIRLLQQDGYNVTAPQFPLTALTDDVARLRQVLAALTGPVVVAGHSYGGQVMTALGEDAPSVVGLVHVAALALDEGESIGEVLAAGGPTPAIARLRIDDQGFAWLPQDDFVKHFAADIDPVQANVLYSVQQPLAASALGDVMGTPAWRSIRTWYAVAQNDEAIPPDVERQFAKRMDATVIEVASGHLPMVSHPDEVADLVRTAARSVPIERSSH
jgi:pimeloyl-ACP methyl ester carboxylesterase